MVDPSITAVGRTNQMDFLIESHKKSKKTSKRQININSFLLAFFFLEKEIILAMESKIKIPMVSFVCMMFIGLSLLINNSKLKLDPIIKPFRFFVLILSFLFLSGVVNGFSGLMIQYIKQFITFGGTALLFFTVEIDYGKVISYLNRISVFFSLYYILFLQNGYNEMDKSTYGSVQMALAYNFLPITIISMSYLVSYSRLHWTRIDFLCALFNLVASMYAIVLKCFTRGAVIAIFISFVFLLISGTDTIAKIIYIVIFAIMGIIVINYIDRILLIASDFFYRFGIIIPSLDRALELLLEDNMSSGRNNLYSWGFESIMRSPIIGNGVGYFEKMYGVYVHNVVIEIICETGIIISFICFWFVGKEIWHDFFSVKNKKLNDYSNFKRILTLSSITPLIFSSTFWISTIIWLYATYIVSNNSRNNKKTEEQLPVNDFDVVAL